MLADWRRGQVESRKLWWELDSQVSDVAATAHHECAGERREAESQKTPDGSVSLQAQLSGAKRTT